jgi:hypothetical protein
MSRIRNTDRNHKVTTFHNNVLRAELIQTHKEIKHMDATLVSNNEKRIVPYFLRSYRTVSNESNNGKVVLQRKETTKN